MKSIKYTLGIFVALLCLMTSCSEDILNITPSTKNAAEDFYKDENQLNQAVLAGYNSLLTMPSGNWYLSEIRSDNGLELPSNAQRDWTDLGYFNATSQTGVLQSTWSQRYTTIYRSNILLEKIEGFAFTRVNQFKAEGRFLRALAYFDLVRYFGDVPLVTKVLDFTEAKQVPRSAVAEVYTTIVDDLKFAVDNLPETYVAADKGRATKWAAKALLGRVYLTMSGFPLKQADKLPLAKAQLADVIAQETKYFATSVPAVFADMFKAANDNKYHVFEVQYVSGGLGLGNYAAFDMAFQYPSQWSAFQPAGYDGSPSPQLVTGWSNTDKRKYVTLDTGYTDTKTGAKSSRVQYTKFLEKGSTVPVDRFDHPNNFPLIRYEDVLLMYAEILNEEANATPPAQAVTILNRIRTRAGMPSITPATQAAFRLAIEQERQWEFCGEGLRWHDLVRTERALTVMAKYLSDNNVQRTIDAHDLIYPIPLKEMLINPGFWKQNPGYN